MSLSFSPTTFVENLPRFAAYPAEKLQRHRRERGFPAVMKPGAGVTGALLFRSC